jgi:hypothetical protein
MDAFESWNEFGIFSEAVERKARYLLDDRSKRFIKSVTQTGEKRKRVVPKDTLLWRAQLDHTVRTIYLRRHHPEGNSPLVDDDMEPVGEVPTACERERMIPRLNKAREGRINPKGIPCLYVAEDKETAMGELRPWVGSLITTATFRIVKDLSVIDCSLDYEFGCQYTEEPTAEKREKAVWSAINEAFSTPVDRSDDTADYSPTQVLGEIFRSIDCDGVRYKSSLGKGFNVALFDVTAADFEGADLYTVKDVVYEFEDHNFDVPGFL